MKKTYIVTLGVFVVVILLSLIIITISNTGKYQIKTNAADLIKQIKTQNHYLDFNEINIENDVLIDVRNEDKFLDSNISESINIPLQKILDTDYQDLFNMPSKKILICNNSVNANVAWMILSQYGVKNIYVLKGGIYSLNNVDSIYNFNDEIAKYNFSDFFSKDTLQSNKTEKLKTNLPTIKPNKKKTVSGGCS